MAESIARVVERRLSRLGRLRGDVRQTGVSPGQLLSAEILGSLYPLLPDPRVPWGGT